ncbi:MAG: cell division protein ZapA [Fidelibacterota bacterium]|nr:MAG: cell division protein ZapA [Candidatus Neomarinimicrobiota bacterium]
MNNPEQNLMRVTIYGHEYTVRAVADPSYIADVAAYVDERMRDTELNLDGPQSPTRISILAAMSITDELFTERRRRQSSLEQVEGRALELSNLVEEVLETTLKD